MRSPSQLRERQRIAILHQLFHDVSMLWMGCGMGKTIVTLSTIEHRMRAGQIRKVLVFAPLRVCHAVWRRESRKWEHTQHLRFSVVGWPSERKRLRHLFADADIYLCNYENMGWLSNTLQHYFIDQGKPFPFDMVVYDEITRVKDSTSQRVAGGRRRKKKEQIVVYDKRFTVDDYLDAGWSLEQLVEDDLCHVTPAEYIRITGWRQMIPYIRYTTGLTGTPAPNGYLDLHGQYLVIDGGERLGQYVTHYKDNYFTQDYDGWSYIPSETGKRIIEERIADITIKMDADPGSMPPLFVNNMMVDLPDSVMDRYREVEQEMYTRLDDGTEIQLFNRASVSNKCLQFCNGAAYRAPNEPEWTAVHDEKLQALDSIIEEAGGRTVLVGYSFKFDAERIMERYKKLKPVNLTKTKVEKFEDVLELGNQGRIRLMVGHPASLGHGVDGLNEFCQTIVWFGCPWSLELYVQMIGRIAAGERFQNPVTMHRILAAGTLDIAVVDALLRKDTDERGLKQAITRYRAGLLDPDGTPSFW